MPSPPKRSGSRYPTGPCRRLCETAVDRHSAVPPTSPGWEPPHVRRSQAPLSGGSCDRHKNRALQRVKTHHHSSLIPGGQAVGRSSVSAAQRPRDQVNSPLAGTGYGFEQCTIIAGRCTRTADRTAIRAPSRPTRAGWPTRVGWPRSGQLPVRRSVRSRSDVLAYGPTVRRC